MKKLLSLLLALALVCALCACGVDPATELLEGLVDKGLDSLQQSAESLVGEGIDTLLQPAETLFEGIESAFDNTDEPETAPTQYESDSEPSYSDPELLDEHGTYSSKDDVALYIFQYGHLPENFITKKQAQNLGWSGGSLEPYAPGKCIGGSHFGNYEGQLPEADGRSYTECDINTLGAKSRGAERIVFSNDGLIYYTADHYETFELLYGEVE